MSRISRDEWAMSMALLTAQRSTCCRRHVGCVLLNVRGHVLSTGYNGVAAGQAHCNEEVPKSIPSYDVGAWSAHCIPWEKDPTWYPNACSGAFSPSGTNLDGCEAIHAEQNALMQCKDVYQIDTCFTTASPCMTCTKLLLNTSCRRIIYQEEYPHPDAKDLWVGAGRIWEKLDVGLPGSTS